MRRFAVILLVLAVSWSIVTSAPAEAATRSFADRAGDVRHGMDIREVTVANNKRLVVTVQHRKVTEGAGARSGLFIDVTPGHRASPDYYLAGRIDGHDQLYWTDGWKVGGRLGCPGGSYRYSYSLGAETTRFSLARSCLDGASTRAGRVRVAVTAAVGHHRPTDWAPARHRFFAWVGLR